MFSLTIVRRRHDSRHGFVPVSSDRAGRQPDTVPQASVDMTSVLEVSEADSVTGHQHSLAITAPERVTFVKGTCREEARCSKTSDLTLKFQIILNLGEKLGHCDDYNHKAECETTKRATKRRLRVLNVMIALKMDNPQEPVGVKA
ncbi:Protein outspread [Operophtera brumata]|uniref:Protein outspread n=1 Tax=Operophtera brumata TaxID=104452 RepID=A0A0L7LSQ2_OPEBR|nr:Protein outspread [Operophtera brumata]